jgi:hypothetical protein
MPRTALPLAALMLVTSTLCAARASAQQGPPPEPPPLQAPAPRAPSPPLARFDPLPPPVDPPRIRSRVMVNTGIGVTVVGAVLIAGSVVVLALNTASQNACMPAEDDCDFSGIGAFIALLMGGLGVGHLAVGVPLLVVGSQPAQAPAPPAIVPGNALLAGSRSLALHWSF